MAWHRKFGFSEEPELHLARLRIRHGIAKMERLKEIGQATPTHRERDAAAAARGEAVGAAERSGRGSRRSVR